MRLEMANFNQACVKATRPDQRPYVLAVDDEYINRLILNDLLQVHFKLTCVDSGQACLDAVNQSPPDLILLDINMPTMNGFEVCQWLKDQPAFNAIPVIFLTAKITEQDQHHGLALGAVDYITKPFSESILLARIQTHLSLSLNAKMMAHVNAQLQSERHTIERIMHKMQHDARFVTQSLRTLHMPMTDTSADVILSARTPDGRRQVLMGDFTGHGLSAAIAAPMVSALFYAQAANNQALCDTARLLNQELCQRLPTELFMAAVFMEWSDQANTITLWNCAMPDVQVFRQGKLLQTVPSSALALGIVDAFYDQACPLTLHVRSGDVLFGFSDGLLDARSTQGEVFGAQKLSGVLNDMLTLGLPLRYVQNQLFEFVGEIGVQDDASVLELRI
ncbi:fused response regulator/phosphatase [Thiomicrorhabdus aquaedulcis]|uniref:fused response regulator/phosphatase n=1 Tax=Thiomicrorhabdus aquaedulcis TaxID=2211106 RepID=UPI000FD867F0|nr:fused response regulator/phosphatase [Thiomicrorhabdus aquaedulcis]